MGGVDAIVFTGGIGEHDADSRAKICHHMDWLGIRIDTEKNKHPVGIPVICLNLLSDV